MARFIKSFSNEQLERGGRRTNSRTDGSKHNFAVYEIIDTETMELERTMLNETKGDDMHQFDDLLTVEDAIEKGLLTQQELDETLLNIWRKQKCSERNEWEGDINYFVCNNAPNDMFLMVPVKCVYKRKEIEGTLVKFYSKEYSTHRYTYGSRQKASVLLPDGKVLDVQPENIIKVTDEAMVSLLAKYAEGIATATQPSFDMQTLFPYEELSEDIKQSMAQMLGEEATEKYRRRMIVMQRMRAGLEDNLNRKAFSRSDEEREKIIHRMMIAYFGEDTTSIGIH